jgi:hypothetical protein
MSSSYWLALLLLAQSAALNAAPWVGDVSNCGAQAASHKLNQQLHTLRTQHPSPPCPQ